VLNVNFCCSSPEGGDRERRPPVQNPEDNGLRFGSRGVQNHADVSGGHVRLDGARSDQELYLLESERRVELRCGLVGVVNGRDAIQRHRHPGRCVRRRRQQTHLAYTEHVSATLEGTHGE
jgi:hypothetical protein